MALLNLHFDFAAYLIEAGADVDKWDLYGRSPLYMAADVSTLPIEGQRRDGRAAERGQAHRARRRPRCCSTNGANPNIQLKRRPPYRDVPQDRGGDAILAQGATPLLRAARAGDAPFVELLLEHEALVDLPSKEGVTPLMAAAGVEFGTRVTRGRNRTDEGVLATMQLLLDAGADVNARMVTEPGRDRRRTARRRPPRPVPAVVARQQVPSAVGRAAPDGAARRGARGLHAVREVPRRERRGSAREGRERPDGARSREGRRRRRASSSRGRAVPGNRRPARVADGRQRPDAVIPVPVSDSCLSDLRGRRFLRPRGRQRVAQAVVVLVTGRLVDPRIDSGHWK